jgi:hypothetical protein
MICRILPILPLPPWPGFLALTDIDLAATVLTAMMGRVKVEEITIGPSDAIVPVGSVTAVAGKDLRGDRHFSAGGAAAGEALGADILTDGRIQVGDPVSADG